MAKRGFLDFLWPGAKPGKPGDKRPGLKRSAPRPPAPIDTLFVECDGEPVAVQVRVRENARRMILRIERRSGTPALTLPRGIGRVRAERFLADHTGWLQARLKSRAPRIEFLDGAEIPVRGEMHRIAHRTPFRGDTRLIEEGGLKLLVVHGDSAHVAARVERFLRKEAEADLARAVARYAGALGVTFGRISVKDTTSRWGSCSSRGDLAFSWRLILAPAKILDYLAAHELAHRLEMNHSLRYWRHVARVCPEFRDAEAWLNRNGAGLHLYGRG